MSAVCPWVVRVIFVIVSASKSYSKRLKKTQTSFVLMRFSKAHGPNLDVVVPQGFLAASSGSEDMPRL